MKPHNKLNDAIKEQNARTAKSNLGWTIGEDGFITVSYEDLNKKGDEGGRVRALDIQIGGSHYKNAAIQPYEFCQKNKLGYLESNIIKYTFRHKFKNGAEDLNKAIHTLQVLLEMEYPEAALEQNGKEG